MCLYVLCWYMCVMTYVCWSEESWQKLVFVSLCGFRELNSGHRAGRQAFTLLRHLNSSHTLILFVKIIHFSGSQALGSGVDSD